jgi:hypothetical protein
MTELGYIWSKAILLLGSRKFWVLLFASLAAYGLDIKPELQALVILIAAVAFAGTQAYEDSLRQPDPTPPLPGDDLDIQ